jgi:hypothetical protein
MGWNRLHHFVAKRGYDVVGHGESYRRNDPPGGYYEVIRCAVAENNKTGTAYAAIMWESGANQGREVPNYSEGPFVARGNSIREAVERAADLARRSGMRYEHVRTAADTAMADAEDSTMLDLCYPR